MDHSKTDTIPWPVRLKYWIPAFLAAALISLFSTHYFTPEETGRVIVPILRWFLPDASADLIRHLHFGIRKLAHVTEFGIFSITVFRAIRGSRTGWQLNWALLTFLVAVSYAALDEFHQRYVPRRHFSPKDIALDGTGALLAQIIVWWYAKRNWPFTLVGKNRRIAKGASHQW
jgi:VanZ family protein